MIDGNNPLVNIIRFGFTPIDGPPGTGTDYLHVKPRILILGIPLGMVRFGFMPIQAIPPPPPSGIKQRRYLFSTTQMIARFGFIPVGSSVTPVTVIDTHDGVKKKKKKSKLLEEEVSRRDRLRRQIEEAAGIIEVVPVEEETEERIESREESKPDLVKLKPITPVIDYAGLAREQIVAKIKDDAQRELQRQIELKRLEDEEEERELMMILDAIL